MAQKRGLGRGLGALIPGADPTQTTVQEILLAELEMNPFQPRRHFNQAALEELAATIREHGVLTPVVVRRGPKGLQVIAGERRIRAARLAGQRLAGAGNGPGGEPPARRPEPPGVGRGIPAADRGVQADTGGGCGAPRTRSILGDKRLAPAQASQTHPGRSGDRHAVRGARKGTVKTRPWQLSRINSVRSSEPRFVSCETERAEPCKSTSFRAMT